MSKVTRRSFLAASAATVGLGALPPAFGDTPKAEWKLRPLGKTGLKVTPVGLGCFQLGQGNVSQKTAIAIVQRAVDLGINYIDTAGSYGQSEARVGKALAAGGRRDKVVLVTKTLARSGSGAQKDLDRSLRRLKTDRIDVWQFHALGRRPNDAKWIWGQDGAMKTARAALKAGKVRFVGITGHADPKVFVDALQKYSFSTLLMPLNCIDPHHASFEKTVLPLARKKGVGIIAMKVLCTGSLASQVRLDPEDCLRYTLGLGPATAILGCKTVREVEELARAGRRFRPLDPEKRADLLRRTKAFSPRLEWYKKV